MLVSVSGVTQTALLGRQRERAALDQFVFKARSGHSRVLVLCGEPGIGKTALLDDLVAHAAGVSVIRMPGVQSEMELAYGALHGLWSQLAEEDVERLPGPQRVALRVTFGLEAGVPPSPLLVGLAMLSGLADLAERQPLLVVVDDAQWLDQASARTLAFVARRLRAEGVGIVFAVRESIEPLRGLPELLIPGLDGDAARGVLASVRRTAVDERILERFIAETGGNPLALLELSQGLTADDPGGSGGLREADSGGVWVVLEESFHRRVEALDADAGTLLLIAAAEPLGDPPLLWRAADLAGVPRHAADELEEAGLLHVSATVVFRHPLVRSATYRLASQSARRRASRTCGGDGPGGRSRPSSLAPSSCGTRT
jgi:hypothetical protein